MGAYVATCTGDVGAGITVGGITGGTGVRPKLYEFAVSCGATPADLSTVFSLFRSTAAGTSTGVTPAIPDPADPAAEVTAGENHSVEPTYTAGSELYQLGLHQRNVFRWVAFPGREMVVPASANAGFGLQSLSSGGTAIHQLTLAWTE